MKKNYKTGSLAFLLGLLCISFFADGQTTFEKIYPAPNSYNQIGMDVLPTSDGGYLMATSTETNIINDIDVMMVKTNSIGDTLWTKRYGGARPDYPNGMLQTSDGNYFVIGFTQSFGGGDSDNYLLKLKPNGDTIFTKRYGGFGNEEGKEIIATADGNYVIVGASNSLNYANYDMQLIKISPVGTIIWTKYYGGPNYESARSVKLCPDGGFIIAGKTAPNDMSVAKIFLVKTNSSGDTTWTKTFGGPNSYEAKSILANSDGTYTLCADDSSLSHDSDVRVMNISATGTINWNKSYGGSDKDICKMIQPTTDGGYIVAAIARSFGWLNPQMWLLKINTVGDTLWTRHYGGPGHQHCYATRQTSDGGFIAVGQSRSYSMNMEIMFVKLDPLGNLVPSAVSELASDNMILNIYPNPTEGDIHIDLSNAVNPGSTLKITNSLGQILFSETIDQSSGTKNKAINLENKKPGIYFVTIQSNDNITTRKLVLY